MSRQKHKANREKNNGIALDARLASTVIPQTQASDSIPQPSTLESYPSEEATSTGECDTVVLTMVCRSGEEYCALVGRNFLEKDGVPTKLRDSRPTALYIQLEVSQLEVLVPHRLLT